MIIHNPILTGSFSVNGADLSTITGSVATSASFDARTTYLESTSSILTAASASQSVTSGSLVAASASLSATSGSLSAASGSFNTRVSALEATGSALSSSLLTVSGSGYATSGSLNTRVSALEVTGSALSSSLLTVSGSGYATSASLSAASGSFNTRVATIESKYATTGSNTFIDTQVVSGSILQSGSFTSTGTLTAQTLVIQTITSSVVYSSGSNVFGNSIGNSQVFTGSVLITGSLTIAGASSATSYSGTTIYGSTVACSPVACFATSCATAFIGGTMSGTTIYGSTAVCSPVGKFTTCLDLGGTLTGTSAIFSSTITASNLSGTNTGDQTLSGLGGVAGNSTILTDANAANVTINGGFFTGYNSTNIPSGQSSLDWGLMSFPLWTGNSSGERYAIQLAANLDSNTNIFIRKLKYTGTYTSCTWYNMLNSSNFQNYALALSGGTLTGTLTFAQPVGLLYANGQYIKDNGNGGLFINSGAAINITATSVTFSSSVHKLNVISLGGVFSTGTSGVACRSIETAYALASCRTSVTKGVQYANGSWYNLFYASQDVYMHYKILLTCASYFAVSAQASNAQDGTDRTFKVQYSYNNGGTWCDSFGATFGAGNGQGTGVISVDQSNAQLIGVRIGFCNGSGSTIIGFTCLAFQSCSLGMTIMNSLG